MKSSRKTLKSTFSKAMDFFRRKLSKAPTTPEAPNRITTSTDERVPDSVRFPKINIPQIIDDNFNRQKKTLDELCDTFNEYKDGAEKLIDSLTIQIEDQKKHKIISEKLIDNLNNELKRECTLNRFLLDEFGPYLAIVMDAQYNDLIENNKELLSNSKFEEYREFILNFWKENTYYNIGAGTMFEIASDAWMEREGILDRKDKITFKYKVKEDIIEKS